MKKNKKAIFYSVTILIFTIFILIAGLGAVFIKTSKEKKIGEEPIELIRKYAKGENALFYIDQAGKYSVYGAMYPFAKKGAYFNEPICRYTLEGSEEYLMWGSVIQNEETKENEDLECYPTEKDIAINFALFLNNQLDNYFDEYNYVSISKNNYEFSFKEGKDDIEIDAIATRDIIIPLDRQTYRESALPTLSNEEQECLKQKNNIVFFIKEKGKWEFSKCGACPKDAECDRYINEVYCNLDSCNLNCVWKEGECRKDGAIYSIKPSFKTEVSYNFIDKFSGYVNKSKEIRDKIQYCLLEGSGKPDDEDLVTCSDVDKLKKEIEDIKDDKIEIKSISSDKNYTLLFNIEDGSFKNPYSKERLVIKFGIRFRDIFPPPATEITGIEERGEEGQKIKYLIWKKNNASDVVSYGIYAKKIEEGVGGVRTSKPNSIEKMVRIKTIEWETEGEIDLPGGDYYFYVIAKDNAGNSAEGYWIKAMEVTV